MRSEAALGPVRRSWESDRISVILSAVAFVGYSTLWWSSGAISGGGDTDDYRAAARAILHGAEVIPDRVPGYPALLVLTGAVLHSLGDSAAFERFARADRFGRRVLVLGAPGVHSVVRGDRLGGLGCRSLTR